MVTYCLNKYNKPCLILFKGYLQVFQCNHRDISQDIKFLNIHTIKLQILRYIALYEYSLLYKFH